MHYLERLAAVDAAGVDVTKLRRGLEGDNVKCQSTIYEIEIAHLFVRAGFTDIVIEPPVPNSNKVADLLVRVGDEDVYVEVEGWDRWSHHHHMHNTAEQAAAAMEKLGYPPADITVSDVRVHASAILNGLPPVHEIDYGTPIGGNGFKVEFVSPDENRHGIHGTRSSHTVQNTTAIHEAYPNLGSSSEGSPSYTDAVRGRIDEGYEQVKPASPEHATVVIIRPSIGGAGVANIFEDAIRGDRVHLIEGYEEVLAGTGELRVVDVRPLDDIQPPEGFQPTGLFNLEGYERLSAAFIYCPPNFMGEDAVFAGIGHPSPAHALPSGLGEALLEAATAEREDSSSEDEPH